ncbi:hypothetical protein [Paenibacillus sp. JDR-2]|uniref:hypothetical protein n=1 Tax=Paenibacillus sp. (strain JDR-2) TaxID=324057 RepID=UPI000166A502|nr:hypothetical protein [Paenibacillus sp. JDR-2]ACT00206.1 hypothetical protein Pjdr2_1534 [Paenibacillus sp. JDR-2]
MQLELITDEDFKFAIESGQTVSYLSTDFIGSGPISRYTSDSVQIDGNLFLRSEFKFFIEKAILH